MTFLSNEAVEEPIMAPETNNGPETDANEPTAKLQLQDIFLPTVIPIFTLMPVPTPTSPRTDTEVPKTASPFPERLEPVQIEPLTDRDAPTWDARWMLTESSVTLHIRSWTDRQEPNSN
jgi:hypothetical protein